MPKIPEFNAPDPQVAWLRWATERITTLERDLDRRTQGETNSNKGQNATLDQLTNQVGEVIETQEELGETQDALGATQVILAQTISDVQDNAQRIVIPVVGQNSAATFTLTTSAATLVSVSLAVPAGYTRALVYASGSMGASTGAGADEMYCYVNIDGSAGPTSTTMLGGTAIFESMSAYSVRDFSPGGSSISVSLAGWLFTGPGVSFRSNATLVAVALFLK